MKKKNYLLSILLVLSIGYIVYMKYEIKNINEHNMDNTLSNLKFSLSQEDDIGYKNFLNLITESNHSKYTKDYYRQLKSKWSGSGLQENYILLKQSNGEYLLIRYFKGEKDYKIEDVIWVPEKDKDLFYKKY
ncbi:MAG: hypothetical protein ACERKV_12645 [Clostridiaceae bacterium]